MRALLLLIALASLPATLAACLPGAGAGPEAPVTVGRAGDAPDWLILAFSGQPLVPTSGTHNTATMIQDGGVGQLGAALEAAGYTWAAWDHASEFYSHDTAGNPVHPWDEVDFASFGFLHAIQELEFLRDNWIGSLDDPTRVIVVAHDHGAVWAHTALHLVPGVPVELLVDLDADSVAWGSEPLPGFGSIGWDALIQAWTDANGAEWAFPVWDPDDAWQIQGHTTLFDIEDLVPTSVGLNFEVRTDSDLLHDADLSVRLDGTTLGIETMQSFESHDRLPAAGSDAMNRAEQILGTLLAE